VDLFQDDLYWVTTLAFDRGQYDAAILMMNKFTRNAHAASQDVLTVLDDFRTDMIIAHPALQMPGHCTAACTLSYGDGHVSN